MTSRCFGSAVCSTRCTQNMRWGRVGETNALAFLEAYCGNPFLDPLPRARENAPALD
jgi:hypothetical protein